MAKEKITNQANGIVNFFQSIIDRIEKIDYTLKELERKIEQREFEVQAELKNKLVVEFDLDDKIREETVRDILGMRPSEFHMFKEQGLIVPVNHHKYYKVRDVLEFKKNLPKLKVSLKSNQEVNSTTTQF